MNIPEAENTILIIEDVPENSMFLSFVLKRAGYTVVAMESGEDACAWLDTHRPVLILCDIMLPGMDGTEVLRHIQSLEHLSSVPTIAITALALPGDKEKLLSAGFTDYVAKPTLAGPLIEVVKRILTV
jgi:CheY-like chemotaxis protein